MPFLPHGCQGSAIRRLGLALLLIAMPARVEAAVPVAPYFNGKFPSNAPGSVSGWTTVNAFPNLTFVDPLHLTAVPGSGDVIVIEKAGKVWRFPNQSGVTEAQRQLVLDLGAKLQVSEDQGLYRLVFHPQYGQAGSSHADDVFVCYSHRPNSPDAGPDKSMWRVSRFSWPVNGGPVVPTSEEVLIQQYDPHRWHNGGAMCFDNGGFLLVTCGDGGGADDQFGQSQRIDLGFFGGVLRIDVDQDPVKSRAIIRQPQDPSGKPASFPASFSQGYGIPRDNPWFGGSVLEEFHAIGLRSPHAANYDAVTGDLWVGDVGQSSREELNLVKKGSNCQWAYREGTVTGPKPSGGSGLGVETPPVYSYGRTVGTCIIGGPRYRGAKWAAELGGRVLFGDNGNGTISTAQLDPVTGVPTIRQIVAGLGAGIYSGIAGISTDPAGEIYVMKLNGQGQSGGTIRKLVQATVHAEPPPLLSSTGIFSNMATLQPSTALVPYEVASPFWSDGASKKRWIAVPNDGAYDTIGERIAFSETGNWGFPSGTIFVKHFEIPVDANNPSVVKRLETRVIVCSDGGGKYGLCYKWNAAGTDAELISEGVEEAFTIDAGNGPEQRTWQFPGRADCLLCHSEASGPALGLRTHQMNRLVPDPVTSQPVEQLVRLSSMGLFTQAITAGDVVGFQRSFAIDDESAPLEQRVRSYLDSNCAPCHQPGGSAPFFDARLKTPLLGQNLINGTIDGQFNLGPDGRYIKPGNPLLSAIHVRTASAVPGVAMPPIGKRVVDHKAAALIESYIAGLTEAEFASSLPPAGPARYLKILSTGNRASVAELSVLDHRGMPIPKEQVSIKNFSSEETSFGGSALAAIDGDLATSWVSKTTPTPHHLAVDVGPTRKVGGFIYQGIGSYRIADFQIQYSQDAVNWSSAFSGTWPTGDLPIRCDNVIRPRPVRCRIFGPTKPVRSSFDVTIIFDTDVWDFQASDLTVSGGYASAVRGKGYYYTATISRSNPGVTAPIVVSLPANAVNASSQGSRAASFSVVSEDTVPPTRNFLPTPSEIFGTFEIGLRFNEPVTGVGIEDFRVENGTVEAISGAGADYVLTVRPYRFGDIRVISLRGGVKDGGGNEPVAEWPRTIVAFGWWYFSMDAFHRLSNPGFSHGFDNRPDGSVESYLEVTEGSRNGATHFDPNIRANYQFKVVRSGAYRVRGLVRADDNASASFYVGVDAQANPLVWNVNRGAGEIGSGQWHWSNAGTYAGDHVFQLQQGMHTVEVYGRDEGTKLGHVELVPFRPFPMWGDVPWLATGFPIVVPLTFTDDVNGLEKEDFVVTGGRVESISGSGRSYSVTLRPFDRDMTILLPENAVTGPGGEGNSLSDLWNFVYRGPYQQWALDKSLNDSSAGFLADGDLDGTVQLLEYAFGLDPLVPDSRASGPESVLGLPTFTIVNYGGQRRLALQYVRRKGIPGLVYQPQFAGSLNDWTDAGTTTVIGDVDTTWERVQVIDTEFEGAAAGRYGRVKVHFGETE